MIESQKIGPLDVIRSVNQQAERCDWILQAKKNLSEDDAIVTDIKELGAMNPLNGREVIIFGTPITPSVEMTNNGFDLSLKVADSLHGVSVRGIYHGLSIVEGIPDTRGVEQNRLTHAIETHRVSYSLPLLDTREDVFYTHVCAEGSVILPVEPVDAHSLADLESNPSAERIDQLIFGEKTEGIDVIRGLSRYFTRRLRYNRASAHLTTMQLASYVDATGFFRDKLVVATDMIAGDHPSADDINPDTTFIFSDHGIEVATDTLALLPGYRRRRIPGSRNDEFYMAELKQMEMYVRGEDSNGVRVTVPLKYIREAA